MAEFIEVARAKRRMCKAHTEECNKCKLRWNCSLLNAFAYSDDDVINLENEVMAWAAENPELKYPTWIDWLVDQGLIFVTSNTYAFNFLKATDPIPADMAEKLGIKPKEG